MIKKTSHVILALVSTTWCFDLASAATLTVGPSGNHATVQAAIDAASDDDIIQISAGTFNENITLNKDLTLQGAGAGLTIINAAGVAVSIPTAGSGSTVTGLSVSGGASGFKVDSANDVTLDGVAADGLTSYGVSLSGVNSDITLKNSSFSNNTTSGIKVPSTSRVTTLVIDTCTVDGNRYGIYAADGNAATYQANVQLNGIAMSDSTFSNNSDKGMYIESMSDALFERIEVVGSGGGTSGGSGSGIDINLKYASYSNLTIRDSLIKGCGTNYSFGGGLLIKARSTGSYSTNPATLGGIILLEGLRVENNGKTNAGSGIRIGDATDETSPNNVTIQNSTFSGNDAYAVSCLVQGATVTATHNHWNSATGPIGAVTNGIGANPASTVTYSPWYVISDAATPPALSNLRSGISQSVDITSPESYGDLYVAPGTTITVTETGSLLSTGKIELEPGAEIVVNGGSLGLGQGSVISGTFSVFNSFGSWDINGDTTFEISQTLALITDIHVTAGKTITVTGGGELVLDGCVIDSQTPGTKYDIIANADGILTMARCHVTDAVIDINTLDGSVPVDLHSRIYDSRFTNSDIEATAESKVCHNLLDAVTNADSNTENTSAFNFVDGWGNVTGANALSHRMTLNFSDPVALVGRTLDSEGNLFVQTGDAISMTLDIHELGSNHITAAEALLGYNADMLTLSGPSSVVPTTGVASIPDWQVVYDSSSLPTAPHVYGLVDSALGLLLDAGDFGVNTDVTAGTVNFTTASDGATYGFFRVQTDRVFDGHGELMKDTRLTKSVNPGSWAHLASFTSNTGTLVIDTVPPVINVASTTATQDQLATAGVDVLNGANQLFYQASHVIVSFNATDNGHGLSGLDAADAGDDLVLEMVQGSNTQALVLGADYTITSATDSSGVVTYGLSIDPAFITVSGTYQLNAKVRDRSGNFSTNTQLSTFTILNEALVDVELQGYIGNSRAVTFVATNNGVILKSWTKTLTNFTGPIGSTLLGDVPLGTTHISAKTDWNLRSKAVYNNAPFGQAGFTGGDLLPGGDLTGDNIVNTLDYSTLASVWASSTILTGDINGDGGVFTADYNVLASNFLTGGDPE